ncbi:hypothetical protein C7H19_15605 [Aphanothece hegewaldii CCALA 016]|uniref:P/Homo B domain-containing protein n=1 Tax=Aphanothece hegewaldii CCALA 016 TaxID=2107694 RepID=A0A2T1LVC1_9CHRO|nr:Calx-beta domain-containing protein [Aphanothece hegewaldii]PSF35666.1 hypothetical protein C7H19_15605 [Aphanothece hegewaldii CCALA 016]
MSNSQENLFSYSFNDPLSEGQESLTVSRLECKVNDSLEKQQEKEVISVFQLSTKNSELPPIHQILKTKPVAEVLDNKNDLEGSSNTSTIAVTGADATPSKGSELGTVTNALLSNNINLLNTLGSQYLGKTDPSGKPLQALINQLLPLLTTTNSQAPIFLDKIPKINNGTVKPQTNQSGPLIRIDQFRADTRFAGINGNGFATVVLDTGINRNHPFFGPDTNNDGISDRIVYQYDFADGDSNAQDFDGHGSNVTSIAASQDGTYKGMAPNANIIALKVFEDSGSGYFSYIEQALQWVVANAATYNIASINMSLGDSGNYNTAKTLYGLSDELAALAALGVIVVSASGNSFYENGSAQGVSYPAADPNSLSVGAVWDGNNGGDYYWGSGATDYTTGADRITSFSQRSSTQTDIFAPGAMITGAGATGTGTVEYAGTSQASPHIAGIAVLAQQLAVQTLGRRLTQSEFVYALKAGGVTINDGDNEDDNVTNTGLNFKRVDMPGLGNVILALANSSGVLEFSSATFSVNENGTIIKSITINRVGGSVGAVSVPVQLDNPAGTATPGTDYTNTLPITVNFANGETSKTVSLPILQDSLIELNESIRIKLGTPTGGATLGTQTTATYFIIDDDTPIFSNSNSITINDSSAASPYPSEINVSGLTGLITKVTVTLNNISHTYPDDVDILLVGPNGQKTILMSDVGGSSDLNGVNLTFSQTAAASLPDLGQITSKTYKPTDIGSGDTFATPAPAGPYDANLGVFNNTGANGIWKLYVVDDANLDTGSIAGGWQLAIQTQPTIPTPAISINDISIIEGNSGTKNATFTVTLSGATDSNVTVNYGTANGTALAGSDYTNTSGTLTFIPGQTSQTFTVPIIGDTTVEPDETFLVNLTSPTNATLADATGQGTIVNNDTTIQFSKFSYTGTEGGNPTTVTITRLGALTNSSTVQFYLTNGSAIAGQDFTNSGLTTITFNANESSKTVSLSPINDTLAEPKELAFLQLKSLTGGTLGAQDVALWYILDNDSSTNVAGTASLMSQSSDPLLASYEPLNIWDNMATSANFFV